MTQSAKLKLEYLQNNAANQVLGNDTFARLDQLVLPCVVDKDLSAPPVSPSDGALYIVGGSPTGAWSGKTNQLAYWLTTVGAWTFVVPATGWRVAVLDELDGFSVPKIYGYTGSAWVVPDAGTVTASPAPTVTETTTSKSLGLTDAGRYIRFTNTGAKTATVPPQSSVSWVADTEIHLRNSAANNLTVTPGSGVTLNAPYLGTLVVPPGGAVTLKRVASDTWDVLGQTVPA